MSLNSHAKEREMRVSLNASKELNRINARRRGAIALAGAVLGTLPGMAIADSLTWVGSGGTNSWSISANWSNIAAAAALPANGDTLFFDAAPPFLSNINDLSNLSINGLTFTAGASSFTLGGSNALTLAGDVSDASPNAQVISMPLTMAGNRIFTIAANGSLT